MPSIMNGTNGAVPHTVPPQPTGSLTPLQSTSTFSLVDKIILVSGAARGLGLTQTEGLLEAGATVYALDRLGMLECEVCWNQII